MSKTWIKYDPYGGDNYGENSKRIRQMRRQAKQTRKVNRRVERETFGEIRDDDDNTNNSRRSY